MLLTEAIGGYIIESQAENKSAKTIKMLRWHLKKFTDRVGDVALGKITPQHVRNFIIYQQGRGLAPHSVWTDYKVLSGFLNWCITEELLKNNPLQTVKPPRLPQLLPKVLAPEQVEQFLDRLRKDTSMTGRRNYVIAMVLLDCGLRANELVHLTLDDLHLDSSYLFVRIGKGGKQRPVPISPTLRRQLWRYVGEYRGRLHPSVDSLFVSREGKKLQVESLKKMIQRALASAGIKGGPHLLRHTCATLYVRNGGDLERLRLLLGHSSLIVTQRYAHLIPEDLIKRHSEVSPLESVLR